MDKQQLELCVEWSCAAEELLSTETSRQAAPRKAPRLYTVNPKTTYPSGSLLVDLARRLTLLT